MNLFSQSHSYTNNDTIILILWLFVEGSFILVEVNDYSTHFAYSVLVKVILGEKLI